MDADLDIDAELGDGTFSIPQYSVSDQLQKVEEQGQDDIAVYNTAVHNMLRRYEYNYLKRRYKSFDLIQNEELCDRYYKDAMNMVQKDGLELATALTTSDQSALTAVRKLAQNFVNVYIPIKQKTQNVSYPWPTYDDDVQLSCLALMQQNEVAKCKAYMLGYLETVSRIPVADQSAQGKIFSNAIAWATGRHPYGSYFTKIVIALKSMLRRVRSELSSGEDLCSRIKMIIDQTTQMWLWSWSKFEAATLHLELSELLKECFQHIVFLAIPTLCQVFLHNSTYMSLHGDTNPFQRQNSSFAENTNTESEVTKGDSSAMLHSATTTTYRVVDPRLVDTNANLHAGSENVQLIIGSRKPAASQESDSRKPDSRVVTSHLPVVCETPEAVPVYDSANEMMYEGDIVLASATVVEDPVIPPAPSTIQAQVEASSAALYEAYNTFSSSYSSVLPPHVTPTTSVPTQSISRHATPSIGFDRIIAVGELEEICGVPLRFRSLTLRGSGALTDISQVSKVPLNIDLAMCSRFYFIFSEYTESIYEVIC